MSGSEILVTLLSILRPICKHLREFAKRLDSCIVVKLKVMLLQKTSGCLASSFCCYYQALTAATDESVKIEPWERKRTLRAR